MSEEKNFKFHKLTPRLVDKHSPSYKISKKALDEAYSDEDIKNIAITGIYGSGKSSFLKTYYRNAFKKEDIINVAIADFENNAEPVKKIKTAERQVINQILYQIPSHKIPLSKFRIKDKRKWWQVLLFSICFCMSTIGIFSLFNRELLNFFYSYLIKVEYVTAWVSLTTLIFLLTSLVIISIWLSRRVSLKLTKFNFKGAESELTENDDAELLDQEAREIVYLIISSGISTIVFEDLDRFEDISIFIRLREINSLVNAKSSKTVRFIYVIRDDLFESKDRTKFFDLMIPVIPEVTSYNSRGKVLEIFSDVEEGRLKIDSKILEQVSVYIDDMRLIYSIRNEYEIYSKSIVTDVYANELFALIVLKNVFPKEFEDLEHDQGYLYAILNKRDTLMVEYEKSLTEKISEREELEDQLVTRLSDFLSVNIPKGYDFQTNDSTGHYMYSWYLDKQSKRNVYNGNFRLQYTFDTFIEELCSRDSSLKDRLEQINYDNFDLKIQSLNDEMDQLKEYIDRRHATKTSNLLAELSEERLSNYFEEDNTDYKPIIENHYYPLIRFLLLSGLVDENYWRYKGYFHEGYLGKDDNIFINRVLSGKAIKNDFHLNNSAIVTDYLEERDYLRKDIVNYDLMDELLRQRKGKEIFNVIKVIVSVDDVEAIEYINSYNYSKLKNLVNILLEIDFEAFYYAFSAGSISSTLKLKFAGLACENKSIEPNIEFKEYVANNSEIIEMDFLEDRELLLDGLERIKIKFEDVSELEIPSNITKSIIEKRLFVVNIENVLNMAYMADVRVSNTKEDILDKFFQYLYNESLSELKIYIEEKFEELIDEYVLKIEDTNRHALSGETVLIDILNSDLRIETKKRFISIEKSIISDISSINDNDLLSELFTNNLVCYNQKNLKNYYDRCEEVEFIIDFINENYKVEFSLSQEMYRSLLNCEGTEINLYKLISEEVDGQIEHINSGLSIEKYMNLVLNNLVQPNKNNFEMLLKTQNDDLIIKHIEVVGKEITSEDISLLILDSEIIGKLSVNVFTNILNMNILEDSYSLKLIDEYDEKISLFSIGDACYEVRKYVLENYFLSSDYQKIIDNFEEFDLTREVIYKVNTNSDEWNELITNEMSVGFVDKLIKDEYLRETLKIELIKNVIEDQIYIRLWKDWVASIESISVISSVFENGRPLIENIEETEVAQLLEKSKVVTIGKDKRLNLRPTRFEKLLKGRK